MKVSSLENHWAQVGFSSTPLLEYRVPEGFCWHSMGKKWGNQRGGSRYYWHSIRFENFPMMIRFGIHWLLHLCHHVVSIDDYHVIIIVLWLSCDHSCIVVSCCILVWSQPVRVRRVRPNILPLRCKIPRATWRCFGENQHGQNGWLGDDLPKGHFSFCFPGRDKASANPPQSRSSMPAV